MADREHSARRRPEGTAAGAPPVSIAVGNTAVEALTALIAGQGGRPSTPICSRRFSWAWSTCSRSRTPMRRWRTPCTRVFSGNTPAGTPGRSWTLRAPPDEASGPEGIAEGASVAGGAQSESGARPRPAAAGRPAASALRHVVEVHGSGARPLHHRHPGPDPGGLGQQLNPAGAGVSRIRSRSASRGRLVHPRWVPQAGIRRALAEAIKAFAKDRGCRRAAS